MLPQKVIQKHIDKYHKYINSHIPDRKDNLKLKKSKKISAVDVWKFSKKK